MKKAVYLLVFIAMHAAGQSTSPSSPGNYPSPATFTAEQDHQNMMDQLGIKALRPGPSGNGNDANHATYDEAKANPCPALPEVLTLKNGKKVTSPPLKAQQAANITGWRVIL